MEQSLQNEEYITNKDKILELRKAQMHKKWHTEENIRKIKLSKKPFPKFGIIVLVYSTICMLAAEYGPWLFIKTKYVSGYEIEDLIFKNFRYGDPQVTLMFKEPFSHIQGLHEINFYDIPTLTNYALIPVFLIGLMIIIYGIMDRKKKLRCNRI